MFGSDFRLENPYLQSEFAFGSNAVPERQDFVAPNTLMQSFPISSTPFAPDGFSSDLIVGFMGEGNDTLIDSARGLIYISTDSGEILRYDIAAEVFLSTIQVGGTLQGLALSKDGNTLVVADSDFTGDPFAFIDDPTADQTMSQFHTIDLNTLAVTTIEYGAEGFGESGAAQVTVDENDTILLTGNFAGSGGTPLRRFADLGASGELSSLGGGIGFSAAATLDTTSDGAFTLIVETNTSGMGHHIYSAETGDVIASSDLFSVVPNEVRSGFNRGLNAISGEAQRVVLSLYNDIFLLDFNLQLVTDLSSFQSAGQIAGNAFSAEGAFIFLWDSDLDALLVYDHANETVVTQIDLDSNIGSRANSGNFGDIKVSEDGLTLVLDTGNGFETVDLTTHVDDLSLFITGTVEADILVGDLGNDTLVSGAGDDILNGGSGNDRLLAGAGDDTANGGAGDDLILGGSGNDTLSGGEGNDTISGQANDDMIDGGAGRDNLNGGNGNDLILGGEGRDFLFGELGNDRLEGGDGDDFLNGGADKDLLIGGHGLDRLYGGSGDDGLFGQQGDDLMFGGGGNDQLFGGGGRDILDGQSGNDILAGGSGIDTVTGGSGADIFVFARNSRQDTITDFSDGEDLLDLSDFTEAEILAALDTAVTVGADTTFVFEGGARLIILGINLDQITADDIIGLDAATA